MSSVRFSRARAKFDQLAEEMALEGVERGSLFGKPCLKVRGKAFACQFQDAIAFKLGPDLHGEALGLKGAQLFDPSGKGRPMKEWVQVPVDHAGRWPALARGASRTVAG
jgi:hypothetical protein